MNEAVLTRWLAACQSDPALQEFARSRRLYMQYQFSDTRLEFYTFFGDGTVQAGLGVPSGKPDLVMKTTAEIFDGMMSGRLDPASAVMSGKVRFTGDMLKAMPA